MLIEPLGPHHDRSAFSCGEPALDAYLRERASQDMRRRIAQVFVGLEQTASRVAGYYALSAAQFEREELPPDLAKRLPHYPVPAAVLGRLAVDSVFQGQGWGETLLIDALRRILHVSTAMAVYAMIVDAKSESAAMFYERYGFRRFSTVRERLFLPLRTFERAGL